MSRRSRGAGIYYQPARGAVSCRQAQPERDGVGYCGGDRELSKRVTRVHITMENATIYIAIITFAVWIAKCLIVSPLKRVYQDYRERLKSWKKHINSRFKN